MKWSRTHAHRCWAEVDLDALRENLAWIRHRVGPGVRIVTVVKADAYGHGLKPIAAHLMQSGTDVFGVANLVEAHAIRSVGSGWPILMLGACLPEEIELAVRDGIMPTLSTLEEAKAFSVTAAKCKTSVKVHLKINTGMNRLGVPAAEALALVQEIVKMPHLVLEGIFTHFTSAEDDAKVTREQVKQFQQLLGGLAALKINVPMIHAANSGALLYEQSALGNAVRPGLIVYGIVPPSGRKAAQVLNGHLRPALSWKCRVSLVKEVGPGTPISYGRTFVTPARMRLATLTAGYGDGYLRAGSNRATVLIGEQRCPIVGRVTMDQMLADVTRVPDVQSGDEAVLIGHQGNKVITANELADWFGTIPWEILTNITYRVPRIYRGSHAA